MTIKFLGGIMDGKTAETDAAFERVAIPVLMEGGFGQVVYLRNPKQEAIMYLNSPIEYIPDEH